MFDCAQSLILNEEVLNNLPDEKRSVFIYEWLCFVNQVLVAAQQNDVRDCQARIIEQILQQTQHAPGPPIRRLIGQTLTTLCTLGDPTFLPNTIKRCHEILQSKDDTSKPAAIVILGALYEDLARRAGRLYEVTVPLLLTLLKNGDSQIRFEVLASLERIVLGLGSVSGTVHREISKIARMHLCDRAMAVRTASAKCLTSVIQQSTSISTSELEGNVELAFRALEGSNYEVRRGVAKYLATLLIAYQNVPAMGSHSIMNRSSTNVTTTKAKRLEETLTYLAGGFSRGTLRCSKSDVSEHLVTIQSEIRIGVTYTYIESMRMLTSECVEQNLPLLISHLLELAGDTSQITTHDDALHSRQCVTFILRSLINSPWNERVQLAAAKEFLTILKRHATTTSPIFTTSTMQSSVSSMTQSYESSVKAYRESTQLVLINALHALSFLAQRLGLAMVALVQDASVSLFETLFSVLVHPSFAVRVSAAWCFRSISTALPSLLTPLIDQCLEKMQMTTKLSTTYNADAASGYTAALEALLGSVNRSRTGIPLVRVKAIVNFAEELLRTAVGSIAGEDQTLIPRFLLQRIHTAWHLLSACCSLGQPYLTPVLPRLVSLWCHVFPRSSAEFDQERQRGDSFTWTLTLNQRSDALCSMIALLNNDLVDERNADRDDVLKQLLNPIESAILILHHIPTLIKHFGQQLKGPASTFRLRLYQLLSLIPAHVYEQHFQILLKATVAELTLSDNALNTSTSLLKSRCHPHELMLLGPCFSETSDQAIEEHLQSHSVHHFGALEHDETYLYQPSPSLQTAAMNSQSSRALPEQWTIPTPMPLNVAVVDAAIILFSRVFLHSPDKHRLQVLQHFLDIVKLTKGSRQETVQLNVLAALSMTLTRCADSKPLVPIENEHCKKLLCTLIMPNVCHSNAMLRCVAGETLARLVQIINDERFRADIAQYCLDRLKEVRDLPSRVGYSLALGCLYRYVDMSSAGQCLHLSVPILLAFAQDASASVVQIWALHALTLGSNYVGHLFRQQIESMLSQVLRLLLTLPAYQTEVFSCCARLLTSLIKIIGSELQLNVVSICDIRSSLLAASQLLQNQSAPLVKAEAMHVLQQLHLFAPRHVNLSRLIPELIQSLTNEDLLVRRASVTCLKQLSQREAKGICEYAREDLASRTSEYQSLEELLFAMLDRETEIQLCVNLQEMLLCLLRASGSNHPAAWLDLLKGILVDREEPSNNDHPASLSFDNNTTEDDHEDIEPVTSASNANLIPRLSSLSQWPTKIFAIVCADRLIACCEQSPQAYLHFDHIAAREHRRTYPHADYLVLHLKTLIVLALVACRSANDQLPSSGLRLLKHILLRFSRTKQQEQMDSPDDLILEQYQTQISAALRPSFSQGTPSHVTAQACDVCSIWVSSGMGYELHDLRRAHQLLIASLQKLTGIEPRRKETNMLQHEHNVTMENLAVLKVWADVYHVAIERHQIDKSHPHASFLSLIQPELDMLIHHWLAALTDYAFLMLPTDFGGGRGGEQISRDGNFYFVESNLDDVQTLYQATWPSLVRAATYWLAEHDYELERSSAHPKRLGHGRQDVLLTKFLSLTLTNKHRILPEKKEDLFMMLLGCCVQSLSIAQPTDQNVDAILSALSDLVRSDLASNQMAMPICIEVVNVLQRLFSVHSDPGIHSKLLDVINQLFDLVSTSTTSNDAFLLASLQLLAGVLLTSYPSLADVLHVDTFGHLPTVDRTDASRSIDLISSTIELLDRLIRLASTNESRERLTAVTVHLLLSTAFVLLSFPSDPATSLLPRIVQFVETSFAVSKDPKTAEDAINAIIDLRRTLIDKCLSDNGHFVRCLTTLIVNVPSFRLTNPIIHFYQQALEDPLSETLECLHQVFLSKKLPLRNTFIRMFTPSLIGQLKQSKDSPEIIAILTILETLLSAVDPTSRVRFASLIIPLFINYLPDSTSSTSLHLDSCLTNYITERLEYLICTYPNECRLLLHRVPELRLKLEHQKRHEREVHSTSKNLSASFLRLDLSNFQFS